MPFWRRPCRVTWPGGPCPCVGAAKGLSMDSEPPVLHVCVTCRGGEPLPAGGVPLGADLFEALGGAVGLSVRPVTCLASCEHGCAAVIAAPGKWTYLLGRLRPELADDLLLYAAAYTASATGTVLPSRRPASLARVVLGRVPGPEALA